VDACVLGCKELASVIKGQGAGFCHYILVLTILSRQMTIGGIAGSGAWS